MSKNIADYQTVRAIKAVQPFRRTVFFISGFHDFDFRFFWPILKRQAKRHSNLYGRKISLKHCDNGALLKVDDFGRPVEVKYRYLHWNDIAAKRIKRHFFILYLKMIWVILIAHLDGRFFALMRAYWGFTNGVYYMVLVPLVISFCLAVLLHGVVQSISSFALPPGDLYFGSYWIGNFIITYSLTAIILEILEPKLRIKLMFSIYEMADSQGRGYAPDLDQRVNSFAEEIRREAAKELADEVLVVGHSYGSILAVQSTGKAIQNLEGTPHTRIALLTLGDINMLYAVLEKDPDYRSSLFALTRGLSGVTWITAFSPQDGLNFPRYNVAYQYYGLPDGGGDRARMQPIFCSLKLAETMEPDRYKQMKYNFWAMHFQYLKEADKPGDYSYFRFICRAKPLCDNYGLLESEKAFKEQG